MKFPAPLLSLLSLTLYSNGQQQQQQQQQDGPSSSGSLEPPVLKTIVARANALLSTGQFNDAIHAFNEAIELSPIDYLLYYKRATAQLSLSRHAQALEDFDQVIKLSNGHMDKAYLMKGTIHTREGQWASARDMVLNYKSKGDKAAQDLLFSVTQGETSHKEAQAAYARKDWDACSEKATTALESATHSIDIRQLRADCALEKGDIDQAAADLTRLTNIMTPSTGHFLRLAAMSYHLLPPHSPPQAISTLKQCLHLDPDNKPCASAHRSYKTLEKSFTRLQTLKDASPPDPRSVANFLEGNVGFMKKYREAIEADFSAPLLLETPLPPSIDPIKRSPRLAMLLQTLCGNYVEMKQVRKGEKYCEELLKMQGFEEDEQGLVGRGEVQLVREEWEDAVRTFEKAFEASGRSSQDVQQRLQRAQRQLKQSKKKDYYKVLGVSRDADDRTIKKGYKSAARKAHPDKGGTEAQMASVNEAYEVLSKPELRQRFDNGDDPMDPTSQQGGNPFFQQGGHGGRGGNPFVFFQNGGPFQGGGSGGGPFQFHFSHGG